MTKFLKLIVVFLIVGVPSISFADRAGVLQFNTSKVVTFDLRDPDDVNVFVPSIDFSAGSCASGDCCKVCVAGSSCTACTNDPTSLGNGYQLTLTSGELNNSVGFLEIIDQTGTERWVQKIVHYRTTTDYDAVPADVTDVAGSPVSSVNDFKATGFAVPGDQMKLVSGSGTGEVLLSSGQVTVGTNNDKTGYALSGSQTFNLTGDITGNLSGSVGSVTGNVGGNVVGDVQGNVDGSVASVTGNVGGNVTGSVGSVTGNVGGNVVGSVASVTGNVGGNVVGSVASVTGNVGGNVVGSVDSVVDPVTVSNASITQIIAAFAADTLGQYIEATKKYVANRMTISGSNYTIYEDNGTSVFETGTTTSTERAPD